MNRVASGLTRSMTRLGPLDIAFAGLDYADGKSQGEDDTRAIAGAAGSTLGGWGGAAAGAAIGAPGGPIGMLAGGLIGGAIGGFGGGWGADRADELIRGNKSNKNMATFNQGMKLYDENGNPAAEKQPDGSWGFLDNIATGTALGTGITGVYNGMKGNNPMAQYALGRQTGIPNRTLIPAVAKQTGENAMRGIRNLPMGAKIAGGAALVYGANKMLGNPTGSVVDAVTGNRTDFDGRGGRTPSQQSVNARYQMADYENPETLDQIQNRITRRSDFEYERNYRNSIAKAREGDERELRKLAMQYRADQARDMTMAFSQSIPQSVANQVQAVMGSRF